MTSRARPFAQGDGPAARQIWDDLGGWYRNTSPTADSDVDRAIARLLGTAAGRRRWGSAPAEAGWVSDSDGRMRGWLYARADPEQNYLVPLVGPEEDPPTVEALFDLAREWFRRQGAERFVVDVPAGRGGARPVSLRTGQVLWRRAVLDRDLSPLPAASAVPVSLREFRRSDLLAAQALFAARHPTPLPPAPVPFLELRGGWFRDPAWELQRGIWLAGPPKGLLGVAGGTHRPSSTLGFLGPWVLAEAASPPVARELAGAVVGWLRAVGAQRVRTSVPTPLGDDAAMLTQMGFVTVAESDLFELTC